MQRHVGDAKKERLGYDLTFSAPKGVSMQALIHGDKTIIEAHEKAVALLCVKLKTRAGPDDSPGEISNPEYQ